ncbi:MAG: HAD family phosphatase [Halobacteriovoraceae bacterium]|nr:HAD family phosphatase [Halobacteriovoraceae bacterium]
MKSISNIKNIIFDFGGVLIDIDYSLTEKAFENLSALNFKDYYSQHKQSSLFDSFETGKITAENFRVELISALKLPNDFTIFDRAWNAMLLDVPEVKLNQLQKLSSKYRLFLLSNTNMIHYDKFIQIIQTKQNFSTFEKNFEKVYYSHIFGLRKPDHNAFLKILDENNLLASETLFIDDTFGHLSAAKELGIHIHHHKTNRPLPEFILMS